LYERASEIEREDAEVGERDREAVPIMPGIRWILAKN
jgi:hypothetical protein